MQYDFHPLASGYERLEGDDFEEMVELTLVHPSGSMRGKSLTAAIVTGQLKRQGSSRFTNSTKARQRKRLISFTAKTTFGGTHQRNGRRPGDGPESSVLPPYAKPGRASER